MASRSGVWGVTTVALMGASFIGGVLLTPHLSTRDSAGTPVPQLAVGESLRGELTSASPLNLKDGSRYQHLKVEITEPAVVLFELDAPFSGTITVLDDANAMLTNTPAFGGGNGMQASFRAPAAGTYTLIVSGEDHRAFGPFTVSAEQINLETPEALSGTGELRGWYDGSAASHTLEVTEEALYTIALASESFDTTLELRGNGISRDDDDGGDGTNSRIEAVLSPGTYTLRVQAFGGDGAGGMYTLAVSSQAAPDMGDMVNEGPLTLGESIAGWLAPGGPNTYTLQVEQAGLHTLDLRSDDFDTVIEIEGQRVSLEDDDGGDDTNSRLVTELPAGEYQVRVRAFGSDGSGTYTLSTRRGR